MNNLLVIQLLGQSRSGKDWTAEQLKAYFESQGKSVEIMSYAAPMKNIVMKLFDISWDKLDDFKNRHKDVIVEAHDYTDRARMGVTTVVETNFRTILQRMGNEAMKSQFGDSVWADLAKKNIAKSSADIIIFADCRFNIELDTIGGITVRVVNNSLPTPMNHASELELLDRLTDFALDNTNQSATKADIASLAQRILNGG
jgi:hypothetical protein